MSSAIRCTTKGSTKMSRNFATKVRERLEAVQAITGGEIRRSKRNVPHLVFPVGDTEASVAYFGKNDRYRLFHPYPGTQGLVWLSLEERERFDFDRPEGVQKWLEENRWRR